jgi:hypothetical protein
MVSSRNSCFFHAPGKRLIEGVPTVWRCQEAPGKHDADGAGLSPDRLCPYNPAMATLYRAHRRRILE